MTTNELRDQESGESVDEQRAEWERFSMTVLDGDGSGYVNVRNGSHENPGEHIYSVEVRDGEATGCSCPHATYRDAHCKHQVAVENRPLVRSSATAAAADTGQQVATDGGTVVDTDAETDEKTDHWGHPVEHYDDDPVGAGESRQCQACGSRFEVALVAATADSPNSRWEEFYRCQNCNAGGSFRVDETQPTHEAQRTWTGMMDYPDE